MSALITSVEHALAVAASDTVKAAKFLETSVLPVLKQAKAEQSTIEAGPTMFVALKEQLGLRVRTEKVNATVYAFESVEAPDND